MIKITEETYQFVTEEVLMVHGVCDRALVPREVDGEILSMSQRVQTLELCYVRLVKKLGMAPPSVIH